MFDGKMKALTFSYDDGVLQDQKIIEIFNKYKLKGTFNLNSGLLGQSRFMNIRGVTIERSTFCEEEIRNIYKGHEVAVHTLTHPNLTMLEERDVIQQVESDRIKLSRIVDYNVLGMAYPCGGENNNENVAHIIKTHTGIQYARTISSTYLFDIPKNLYRLNPTVYHMEWDKLHELAKQFIDLKPEYPSLFYIWGHSYELDIANTWNTFEDICRDLSGRSDIFYGTNHDVLL